MFSHVFFYRVFLVIVLLLAPTVKAHSACKIFIPQTTWNYYGYTITAEDAVQELLLKKKYTQVFFLDEADSQLLLDVTTQDGGIFRYATAEYAWKTPRGDVKLKGSAKKTCLTSLCAVADFLKPLNNILNDLNKKLPACETLKRGAPATPSVIVLGPDGKPTEMATLVAALQTVEQVILGERHDSVQVQNMEAFLIQAAQQSAGNRGISLAWEFLNWSERTQTLPAHLAWCEQLISDEALLKVLFDRNSGQSYLPVLKTACGSANKLVATNLTREEKAPAVQGGIAAMNPRLVPPGFELGGENYWQRFLVVMQGHAPIEMIKNYFVAQSLVDDVMAVHTSEIPGPQKQVVLAGHFHTDYFDGLYARLQKRQPLQTRLLVTVVDSEEVAEQDLTSFSRSPLYGSVSDFVIWIKK